MIKQFNDFNQTKAYGDSVQLPRGAYVCKILDAKVVDGNFGQSVKVRIDIVEGEYSGYFQKKYDASTFEDKKWPCVYLLNIPLDDGSREDGWTKRKFKTFTDALEDSNEGYHFDWDEKKFKGKLIGVLFNYREYVGTDGNTYSSANAAQVTSVANVHDGNVKIPQDKLLKKDSSASSFSSHSTNTSIEPENIPF